MARKKLTVKGVKATPEQARNMALVIATSLDMDNIVKRAVLAVICAVIVESTVKNLPDGDRDSRGILQVRDSTARPMGIDNTDIAQCVKAFQNRGFWGKGGAIGIANRNPSMSPGAIAQQVQGSGVPDAYQKYESEANDWLSAALGDEEFDFDMSGGGGSYTKSYQYTRNKGDDNWTTMRRLADEVNWRLFMVGRAMYYMSEKELYKRRVRYTIKADGKGSEAVLDFQYDIDWGKRVNEAEATVTLERWGAPPGSVIMVKGYGPPDGRWLVHSINRDWFSPVATVRLKRPTPPRAEPAPEVVQDVGSLEIPGVTVGGAGDVAGLIAICNKYTGPYDTFIGDPSTSHGVPLSSLGFSHEFDCSSSTSHALYHAGFWDGKRIARTSSGFADWGQEGRGDLFTVCYNSGHVYIRFEPKANTRAKRFDTGGADSGGGRSSQSGPRLRYGNGRPTDAGFALRHWRGM